MNILKYLSLLFIVFISVTFLNCSSNSDSIKIGVVMPFTWELGSYGKPIQDGIDIALNELNSTGGIKGKKINLIIKDSKADPQTAISILQSLISIEGIKYVIGDVGSNATLAMLPICEKNKIFLFSPRSC